jgi:hypothetical protein
LPNKAKSAEQLAQPLRSEVKEAKGQFDHWTDGSDERAYAERRYHRCGYPYRT